MKVVRGNKINHEDTEGTELHGEKRSEEREVRSEKDRTAKHHIARITIKDAKVYAFSWRSLRLHCALCGPILLAPRFSLLAPFFSV